MQDNADVTGADNLTVTANSSHSITASAMNGATAMPPSGSSLALGAGIAIVIASDTTTASVGSESATTSNPKGELQLTGGLTIGASGSYSVSSVADATTATNGGVGIGASVVVNVSSDSFDADLDRSVSAAGAISVTADPVTATSQAAAIASESGAPSTPAPSSGTGSASGSGGDADTVSQNQDNFAGTEGDSDSGSPAPGSETLPSSNSELSSSGSDASTRRGRQHRGDVGGHRGVRGRQRPHDQHGRLDRQRAHRDLDQRLSDGPDRQPGQRPGPGRRAGHRRDQEQPGLGGAAVSVNVANVTNTATIGTGDTISADGVTVAAGMVLGPDGSPMVNDFSTQGLGVAIGKQSSASIAGSVGINVIAINTQASIGAVSFTGTLNGTNSIKGVSSTTGLVAGDTITGPGIPYGTTITGVNSSTITLSNPATLGGSGSVTETLDASTPLTQVKSYGGLTVDAENDETLQNIAVTLAVSGGTGAGAAVDVNVLNNTTNAFLGSNVQANVAGQTQITANSSLTPGTDAIPNSTADTLIPEPITITGTLTAGSNVVSGFSASGPVSVGQPVTGPDIPLGTFIAATKTVPFTGTLNGTDQVTTDTISGLVVGETVAGPGINPGTTIQSISYTLAGTVLTLSQPADALVNGQTVTGAQSLTFGFLVLSEPATATPSDNPVTLSGYTPASIGTQVLTTLLTSIQPMNVAVGVGVGAAGSSSGGGSSGGSGGSGSSGSGVGIAFSCIVNVIGQTTDAYIDSGAQINTLIGTANYPTAASDESVTVSATETTTLLDLSGTVAIGKSAGTSAGIGAGLDVNIETEDAQAYIAPGATVDALQNVEVMASTNGSFTITAAGGAVAASTGSSSGGSSSSTAITISFTAAVNVITSDVSAYIDGATVQSTQGNVEISATAAGTISATVIPFSASVSNSSSGSSTSVSGAGAVSLNDVLTNVNAYGLDSSITAGQAVSLNAEDSTQITATVITIAISAAVSEGGKSTSGSVGALFSENLVGYKLDYTKDPAEVQAYLENTSVSAGGALSLNASTAGMQINSTVVAGSVAVAGSSGGNAYSLGGSGVYSDNQIALDIESYLLDIPTPVTAASVSITASDTSSIMATAGAASVAASLSSSGNAAAIAIGVSLATNEIDNVVQAYLANVPTVTTTSGGISITSTESATISTVSAAAAVSASFSSSGNGVAISGAGAEAQNTILGTDNAYVSDTDLSSATSIALNATDASQITATIVSVAVSLGISTSDNAVGASIGIAVVRNFIGNSVDTLTTDYDYQTSDNVLTVNYGDTVKIASGALAGDVYEYVGSQPITVPYAYTAGTSYPNLVVMPGQSVYVPAGTDGVTSDTVYQYIGSAKLSNPDLTTENYSDPTMWQQVTALESDYSNSELWKLVNVNGNPLQVEA